MIGSQTGRGRARTLQDGFSAIRGALAGVLLFSLFINLLMLVAPVYMLQVYDRVLTSRNETTLVMLTLIAVSLLLVYGLLDMVRTRLLVRVGLRFDEKVKARVFAAVFRRGVQNPGGGDAEALRDLDSLRDFIGGQGMVAFCDAPWVPIFIGVVFMLHPVLGLVALAGAVLIFALALANELSTRRPLTNASRANITANAFLNSSLRNGEAVAAMGMLPGILERWNQRHDRVRFRQAKASDRSGTVISASRMLRLWLQVAMLGLGAYLVLLQQITPGVMIAASIIMGRALAPVEAAVGHWRGFINARTARRRLDNLLLASESTARDHMPLPAPKGALSVEQLLVAAPGSRTPILRGLSFQLEAGEALGVVGASGAGKTTLARALMGVWPIASGSVRLDGSDISDWDRENLGPHLGYLPQDVELFDGTVAENIARFGPVEPDKVVRAAEMAGVHEMIQRLEDGYDSQIGPGGQSLSGGQRQRIALARTFYGDVRFAVLDEPNANLDDAGDKALSQAIRTFREQQRTLVMITHRLPLLADVDKILVLGVGQVQAFGPGKEVMARLTRPSVLDGRGKTTPNPQWPAEAGQADRRSSS